METNREGIMAAYCNINCKLSLRILHLDIAIDEPAKNRCVCNKFRKRFVRNIVQQMLVVISSLICRFVLYGKRNGLSMVIA